MSYIPAYSTTYRIADCPIIPELYSWNESTNNWTVEELDPVSLGFSKDWISYFSLPGAADPGKITIEKADGAYTAVET